MASTEIGTCGVSIGTSPSAVRRNLREPSVLNELITRVSKSTTVWLNLQLAEFAKEIVDLPEFPAFTAKKLGDLDTIVARSNEVHTYICSVDGVQRMPVKVSDKWPFDRVADDHRFAFVRSADGLYRLSIRDPRLESECIDEFGS